jgi:hypothetical protein
MENYEFNDKQNGLFRLLQLRMRFVGVVFIVVGFTSGLLLVLTKAELINLSTRYNIIGTVISVFLVITGILFWKAANSFQRIIKTQGSDIDILMNAIKDLYLAFDIQMYVIIISVFFIVIASVFLRDFSLI